MSQTRNHDHQDQPDDESPSGGEVSEVGGLGAPQDAGQPITPGDATAGYPDEQAESGEAQEGTAGPNAAPRHGRTEPTNESSR